MDRRCFLMVSSLAALVLTSCSDPESTPTPASSTSVTPLPLASSPSKPIDGWTGSVVTWDAEDATSAVTVGVHGRKLVVNRTTDTGLSSSTETATGAQLDLLGKTVATLTGKQPTATPGSGLAASVDLRHVAGSEVSYAAGAEDAGYPLIVALVKELTKAA